MTDFLLGALAMAAIVTFAPPWLASKPSEWLRKLWAMVGSKKAG